MATIPQEITDTIRGYVKHIEQQIPVRKAIVFGSFAKGNFDEQSDIDLAIFSDHFASMSRVEGTTYLLTQALRFGWDLEPIAFTGTEYDERLGIVEEIIHTGIDVADLG